MINYRYQLVQPKKIVKKIVDEDIKNKVVVKPTYLSICAADQRYFQGTRDLKVLSQKLPLVLIHEAVGEVILDNTNTFKVGDKVVLLPLKCKDRNEINANYNPKYKFMSSSTDGFMQEKIVIDKEQLIKYTSIKDELAVFIELLSVAIHAIESISNKIANSEEIAIWGNGNLGYLLHLYLKHKFPKIKLHIIGINDNKLKMFAYADNRINLIKGEIKTSFDVVFEVVGGETAGHIINQAVDILKENGYIVPLGVSEQLQPINTRSILEKGITLIGRSRSSYQDFKKAISFLKNANIQKNVKKIIAKEIRIQNENDMIEAFDYDITHDWKTIMKWEV